MLIYSSPAQILQDLSASVLLWKGTVNGAKYCPLIYILRREYRSRHQRPSSFIRRGDAAKCRFTFVLICIWQDRKNIVSCRDTFGFTSHFEITSLEIPGSAYSVLHVHCRGSIKYIPPPRWEFAHLWSTCNYHTRILLGWTWFHELFRRRSRTLTVPLTLKVTSQMLYRTKPFSWQNNTTCFWFYAGSRAWRSYILLRPYCLDIKKFTFC